MKRLKYKFGYWLLKIGLRLMEGRVGISPPVITPSGVLYKMRDPYEDNELIPIRTDDRSWRYAYMLKNRKDNSEEEIEI